LPSLEEVAASPQQHTYHALLVGGDPTRAARARQSHALALASAKPGSRWWLQLKQLNQQCEAACVAGAAAFLGIGALPLLRPPVWLQPEAVVACDYPALALMGTKQLPLLHISQLR
jgi:hypothetical protein